MGNVIKIKNIKIGGNNPLVFIAGVCIIENEDWTFNIAKELKQITKSLNVPFIFKASYDKANRSSVHTFRGIGFDKGIRTLKKIKKELNVPILTDVHCQTEIDEVAKVADVIQIPAFLCRQTSLIIKAASTGKVINVKKGQFLSPFEVKNVVEKIKSTGNDKIMITERGYSFGYNNLVVDMRSFPIMKKFGCAVIYDATHSLMLPGGEGTTSGGEREYIPYLARATVAVGIDGVFMEVHNKPEKALSDKGTVYPIDKLCELIEQLRDIDQLVKGFALK